MNASTCAGRNRHRSLHRPVPRMDPSARGMARAYVRFDWHVRALHLSGLIGKYIVKKLLVVLGALLFSQVVHAASVVGSRHDLSTPETPQVCEFCHTPHHANINLPSPLWNRAETTQTFTLYGSVTMDTATAQPKVASRLVPQLSRRRQRLDDGERQQRQHQARPRVASRLGPARHDHATPIASAATSTITERAGEPWFSAPTFPTITRSRCPTRPRRRIPIS